MMTFALESGGHFDDTLHRRGRSGHLSLVVLQYLCGIAPGCGAAMQEYVARLAPGLSQPHPRGTFTEPEVKYQTARRAEAEGVADTSPWWYCNVCAA